MTTLFDIITSASSLAVQTGTTMWDHLNNLTGGSGGFLTLSMEVELDDTTCGVTQQSVAVEVSSVSVDVAVSTGEVDVDILQTSVSVDVAADSATVDVC